MLNIFKLKCPKCNLHHTIKPVGGTRNYCACVCEFCGHEFAIKDNQILEEFDKKEIAAHRDPEFYNEIKEQYLNWYNDSHTQTQYIFKSNGRIPDEETFNYYREQYYKRFPSYDRGFSYTISIKSDGSCYVRKIIPNEKYEKNSMSEKS